MIWKCFRPKPIVTIELPYESDEVVMNNVSKQIIDQLKNEYHVILKWNRSIDKIQLQVHNQFVDVNRMVKNRRKTE